MALTPRGWPDQSTDQVRGCRGEKLPRPICDAKLSTGPRLSRPPLNVHIPQLYQPTIVGRRCLLSAHPPWAEQPQVGA